MSTHVEPIRWVKALRTQANTSQARPTNAILCPYYHHENCTFQSIDQLLIHVNLEHGSRFTHVKPDRVRTQLQEDVFHKQRGAVDRFSKATAGGVSTPDMATLTLDTAQSLHTPSGKKRAADTTFVSHCSKPTRVKNGFHTTAVPERQITKSKDYYHGDSRDAKIIKPASTPTPSSIESSNLSTLAHLRQHEQTHQPMSATSPTLHQQSLLSNLQEHDERYPGAILQPESRPISQEQLASEVKSIYADLSMVENKCIHVDLGQAALQDDSRQPPELVPDHWQALITLHRILLHEHHDFFLASQHPSASPALRQLAAKYSMPARMWEHGIHSFLELLRQRLPESLDFMLAFIYLSYQMMALLYETVPAFEEMWIECLGDLGRYRMAIEETDDEDRETWAVVASSWYNKATDKNPSIGRIYHHLAILARHDALQQLYYFSRSLNCVEPFSEARESILTLLDQILGRSSTSYPHTLPIDANFIQAHGVLFEKSSADQFEEARSSFQSQLDHHIGRVTAKWKDQGIYIAITNLTGLFDYGESDSILRQTLELHSKQLSRPASKSPDYNEDSRSLIPVNDSHLSKMTGSDISAKLTTLSNDFTFSRAYLLTMTTLSLVLRRGGDENVLPHVHILLAFFHSFASIHYVANFLDDAPWRELAAFLNELLSSEKPEQYLTGAIFPTYQTDALPLPEDYHVRGQIWSQWYFPESWFAKEHDEEDRYLELASTTRARIERVLHLGHRLSTFNRWIFYDLQTHTFSAAASEAKDSSDSS